MAGGLGRCFRFREGTRDEGKVVQKTGEVKDKIIIELTATTVYLEVLVLSRLGRGALLYSGHVRENRF